MRKHRLPGWSVQVTPFVLAIGATALAVLLRWLLDPWLSDRLPFVTIFGAVAAAAWLGGYLPGAVATILGFLAVNYLFIEPRGSQLISGFGDYIGLAAYLFTCSLIIGIGHAMRLAQRRTKEGRDLLMVTFASIGDAVIATDADGRITYLNTVAESLTGWTEKEARKQPVDAVFRIVNEETRKPVENPVARALEEGRIVGLANHTILITKGGAELPIDDSASPIKDSDGHVIGCVLIFRDISEQKHAVSRLRESEERFRILANSSPALIWINGVHGAEFVNSTYLNFLGVHDVDVRGYDWAKFIHPDDKNSYVNGYLSAAQAQSNFEAQFRFLRHDGEYRWMRSVAHPRRNADGDFIGYAGTTHDITEHIRTEEALRDSERRFRAYTTATSEVVYRMSPDWTEMRELRGRGFIADTLVPSKTWLDKYIHPDDQCNVMDAIHRAIDSQSTLALEHRVIRADGSLAWTYSRAIPIVNDTGEVIEWFGAASDVTQRKQAEEALRDADKRKDEFLAILAHELRNPLAPLRNGLEILRRTPGDCADTTNTREMMERQVTQMTRLVDDLLDVSRITSGKLRLRKQSVDVSHVLASAVETVRPLIDASSQQLTVSVSSEPITVRADPIRLAQVFANLLNNASKYTEKGGHIWLNAGIGAGSRRPGARPIVGQRACRASRRQRRSAQRGAW